MINADESKQNKHEVRLTVILLPLRLVLSAQGITFGNYNTSFFQKQPDDEDFLVDNEEEMDLKEEPDKAPVSKEYLGKLQYKVSDTHNGPFLFKVVYTKVELVGMCYSCLHAFIK